VSTATDWMVVAGFVLAVLGVSLRVTMMMRASDAHPSNVAASGRDLLRSYNTTFPRSHLPMAMWLSLCVGLALVVAGLLLELR
jgi:hypothetical protein